MGHRSLIAAALLLLLMGCPIERRLEHSSPQALRTTSGEVELSFWVYGEGRPLLIIHGGFGSDHRGFEDLALRLAKRHQVILFDRRGTGKSPLDVLDTHSVTMDLMVSDIEAIRRALGLESWSVLGHSFGGMLASHYVALHPDRVDALVLSSSSGVDMHLFSTDPRVPIKAQLNATDRAEIERLEAAHEAGDNSQALRDRFSEVLARAYVYDDDQSDWVQARLRRSNPEVARLVTADLNRIAFDTKPALAQFERPVLIVQGRQDILPVSISERAAASFPDARLVVVDECGHYGWLDQARIYLSTVLDFLRH
ncbi:MAG: alpha/beta hydrolase [Myxococcota bacterium]